MRIRYDGQTVVVAHNNPKTLHKNETRETYPIPLDTRFCHHHSAQNGTTISNKYNVSDRAADEEKDPK